MSATAAIRNTEDCDIGAAGAHIRGFVASGVAHEVQECYRAIVNECLQRSCQRALIVGVARGDAFTHLAVRDAIRSMAIAGVPQGFRLAFVALSAELIAVYDAAVVEAQRRGIDARRFADEKAAAQWLDA
jgi:hypothetical protein